MKSALILPTEECVDSVTIKRALLNYERVYLRHPEDRDFVNGSHVMSLSTGIRIGMGQSVGNVRPLGKTKNYDKDFERLLTEYKSSIKDGTLVVMDKCRDVNHKHTSLLFSIPPSNYFIYGNYRHMAATKEFVAAAGRGINRKLLEGNNWEDLAPAGCEDKPGHADESLNYRVPYQGFAETEDELKVFTRMAHARIASIARNLIICHENELAPFTTNIGYASLIRQMQSNFSDVVRDVQDGSIELSRLDLVGMIENLIFTHFLDQNKIEHLSTKQALRLRAKMWGRYGENKLKLEERLLRIALDSKDINEFEKTVKVEFEKFLRENRDYLHEWKNLGYKLVCEVGAVVSGSSLTTAVIQSFISASSWPIFLTATFLHAGKRLPEVRTLLKQEKELVRLPAYELYNYVKQLPLIK